MEVIPVFVGIDVSKAQLDVAMSPTGEQESFSNDETGIKALVKRLGAIGPALIVLEATGGFELGIVRAPTCAELPVVTISLAKSETSPRPPVSWPRPIVSMP